MSSFEIPMDNTSPAFNMYADLDNNTYQFNFRWNDRVNLWLFDLLDNEGEAIFLGKPFQTEVHFLQQSVKVNTPTGMLYAKNSKTNGVDADRFAIGGDVKLYYSEAG
jgi:hypothetical protein